MFINILATPSTEPPDVSINDAKDTVIIKLDPTLNACFAAPGKLPDSVPLTTDILNIHLDVLFEAIRSSLVNKLCVANDSTRS